MKYIRIDGIDNNISVIALGTTYFGTEIGKDLAFRMLDTFADSGGTVIDTARVYGQVSAGKASLSEEVIGEWLSANGMQKEMVVITKGAHPHIENMKSRMDRDSLLGDLEMSLKALSLTSIDLWMLHRDDPSLSVSEIGALLEEISQAGTIKAFGLSNWSRSRFSQASDSWKIRPAASEIQYSLAPTTARKYNDPTLVCMDREEFSFYEKQQVPLFAFSSQAKGFFSKCIEGGIDTLTHKVRSRFLSDSTLRTLESVRKVCREMEASPAAVSLAALIASPFPVIPIIGCSTLEQLSDSLKAADLTLDDQVKDTLLGGMYEPA